MLIREVTGVMPAKKPASSRGAITAAEVGAGLGLTVETLRSFMALPAVKKILAAVLKKSIPGIAAYYTATDAYDQFMNGEYRNMFIDLADAGLSIASLFGYAAGGVAGAALTAAGIAGQLYVARVDLLRAWFASKGLDTSSVPQDKMDELADQLTKAIAQQLYDDLKAAAVSAMQSTGSTAK
jgi:hypothetical protein